MKKENEGTETMKEVAHKLNKKKRDLDRKNKRKLKAAGIIQ